MAVVDKFINDIDVNPALRKQYISTTQGAKTVVLKAKVASGDDNNSIYRLFTLSAQARLLDISIYNTAISGGTAYDLGLYTTGSGGGAPLDNSGTAIATAKDMFLDGVSFATARAITAPLNGLTELGITSYGDSLRDLLGIDLVHSVGYYDLAFTAVTAGTVNGDIIVKVTYLDI